MKKIRRESELKKMVDDFGNLMLGKHQIHNFDVVINGIGKDSVKAISKYGEGFRIEEYKFSESNQFLKAYKTEIIEALNPLHFKINQKYNQK